MNTKKNIYVFLTYNNFFKSYQRYELQNRAKKRKEIKLQLNEEKKM